MDLDAAWWSPVCGSREERGDGRKFERSDEGGCSVADALVGEAFDALHRPDRNDMSLTFVLRSDLDPPHIVPLRRLQISESRKRWPPWNAMCCRLTCWHRQSGADTSPAL